MLSAHRNDSAISWILSFWSVFWCIWWGHHSVLWAIALKLFALKTFIIPLWILVEIFGQFKIKCSLSVFLYLWGIEISFVGKWVYNLGQNICRLSHILTQLLFTSSGTKLDFVTRKGMYELPHELPNNLRLRIIGNYQNPWNTWIWWQVLSRPTKCFYQRFS